MAANCMRNAYVIRYSAIQFYWYGSLLDVAIFTLSSSFCGTFTLCIVDMSSNLTSRRASTMEVFLPSRDDDIQITGDVDFNPCAT